MIRRSTPSFNCNECDEVYYKKFDFYEHWNIHSKQTPFKCGSCFECFSLIKDYANHYKSVHLKSKKSKVSKQEFDKSLGKSTNASKRLKPRNISKAKIKSRGNSKDLTDQNIVNGTGCVVGASSKDNLGKEKLSHLGNENNDAHKHQEGSKVTDKSKDFENHLKENSSTEYSSDEDISDDDDDDDYETESRTKSNSNNPHKYHCECCDFRFVSRQRLIKHVCYIKPVFGENFKCSCSKEFTTSSDFRAHIGKKPYICCLCSMMFSIFTNFIRHIRTHTNQKPYICNLCGKQFSQSSNLRTHCNIHLNYNAFKCDECKFSCKTLSGITKHKIKHKNGIFNSDKYVDGKRIRKVPKTIPCPVCKRMFSFERNMKFHLQKHDPTSTLCIECGKIFESKHKLDNHFKACHEKPSKCSFCGKVFASALLLYAHKRIHKKTKKLLFCDICGKSFAMRNYLAQHIKTHSKEKKYFCENCGKQFKVNASLKYHRKICSKKNQ